MEKIRKRILKAPEKSNLLHTKETRKAVSRFFSRNYTGQKEVAWHIPSAEKKKTSNKELSTHQGYHSELEIKSFPGKQKLKEFITMK